MPRPYRSSTRSRVSKIGKEQIKSQLVVVAFDDESTAFRVRDKLGELQRQHLIKLDDLAVAARDPEGKVKIKQATDLVGAGALGGAFWGMLIGLIFFVRLYRS